MGGLTRHVWSTMSAQSYRSQLERKRQQRVDAEKKAGDYRIKESKKRSGAAAARSAATRTKSSSTAVSKLREADRLEREAAIAANEANRWQARAASFSKEEASLMDRLVRAEASERADAERRRVRERQLAERRDFAARAALEQRLVNTEQVLTSVTRHLREPRNETLRVLILGASSEGDLRVGREQKRIRAAVESALHRDQIQLDVRPAATTADLLDGMTRFRPHVVHFSGHGGRDLIVFEEERDEQHAGQPVTATAFLAALEATDDPPLLVLLNACDSADQAASLVGAGVPFAIGMTDEIDDGDAINYAAQFYAALANGQSIQSAHLSGQAALQLAGLTGAELPTLVAAEGVDAAQTWLVRATA